jgi:hypothetical protein
MTAALAVGAFVGVIGPFGTFLFGPTWLRIAYWATMFGVGQLMFGTGMRATAQIARQTGWPEWPLLVLASAVLAGPMSALCAVTDTALWPRAADYMHPLDWYLQVLFVSVPLNLVLIWLRRTLTGRLAPVGDPVETPRVQTGDLRDRLPARLGDRIVCLQMEDHYVRVHTDRGSELVLTPLKDALTGMPGVEGLQTHRSWWVARDAVRDVVWSGRNVRLRLVNGLETPVARSAVAKLRDAGWLGTDRTAPVQPPTRGA